MILVEIKENEAIDRALKRFKKKIERVGILKEARKRMAYIKPTISRKAKKLKAMHKYRMLHSNS